MLGLFLGAFFTLMAEKRAGLRRPVAKHFLVLLGRAFGRLPVRER